MQNKRIFLIIALIIIAGSIIYLESKKVSLGDGVATIEAECMTNKTKSSVFECYHEISTPDGFINTSNLKIGDLIGKKVVLVDFWTYSCINCQRTQPYLNAWYEKYKDQGLEIIGIHTPEFEFEKKYENVLAATKSANIEYPVVLDNDFSTWRSYRNRYWPRKYLIDIDGFIVYDHIGEGGYEETEKKIQEALEERKIALKLSNEISKDTVTPEGVIVANHSKVQSPEIYFGAKRNENFGNGPRGITGIQAFSLPTELIPNMFYLVGQWEVGEESVKSVSKDAKIYFYYKAKNVYMVASSGEATEVKILNDSEKYKNLSIEEETLYQLIENPDYGAHLLEIFVPEPGFEIFTLTFG